MLASGAPDDSEMTDLAEVGVCGEGLTAATTKLRGASWARAAKGWHAVVRRAADSTDQVELHRGGRSQRLPELGGHSTNIPVPFDDGSVAVAVADDRGMRVDLVRDSKPPVTIMTSPSTIYGFDYTPSGRRFVAIDRLGVPGAYTGTRLTVADASGVRQQVLPRALAARLVVLDEDRAIVGDITSQPGAGSVLVDLNTGVSAQPVPGLFPIAYDAAANRVLMRDDGGAVWWLPLDAGTPQPITGLPGFRVVAGDLVR